MEITLPFAILLMFLTWAFTYIAIRGSWAAKIGKISEDGYSLPLKALYKVLYSDKTRTVLEKQSSDRETWTISTRVFVEKPIRPGDIVRHVKDTNEMKKLGIETQPFQVLVKDTEIEQEIG